MVYVPRVDGVARVGFEHGVLTRNSVAWSPDNGRCFQPGDPRLSRSRIPILNVTPRIYHTFDVAEGFMDYASGAPGMGLTWCVGAGGRLEAFELAFPEFVRETYGTSTLGKDLYAYRLVKNGWVGDPLATKHFVVSCVCHGNEVDGINGAFKAMEILARHGDFAEFRSEWTILFIPFLNPDGWEVWNRHLQVVGPNGELVNLNRQADWFWSDYVEESGESKGSAPWSEDESVALMALYSGIVAAGGSWGVFLDLHSTEGGGGARYYTRDRLMQHVTGARGVVGEVPSNDLTCLMDYYIWQTSRAFAIKRVADEGGPDLFLRLYRSRFSPKLHSYFSSQGVFAAVVEEAKVASAPAGTVTYKSACNFRLDHILATALCCTASNWGYEDAILLEPGTTNVLSNASFAQWQGDAEVGFSSQVTDDFTLPNSAWFLTDTTLAAGYLITTGSAGSAVMLTSPKTAEMLVQVEVKKAASDTILGFFVAARALFSGAAVTDGYKLYFDDATKLWTLSRFVASAETVIETYDASSSSSRQLTTTQKTVYLRVRYSTPVELYARIKSGTIWYTLFDTGDPDAARVLDINQCGFGGQSDATDLYFYDFVLQTNAIEERPRYFTKTRADISRCTPKEGEKFYDDLGEALKITAHPDIALTQGAEFCAGGLIGADGEDSGIAVVASYDGCYVIPPLQYLAQDIYVPGALAHATPFGCAVVGAGNGLTLWIIGGGTAAFAGAGKTYSFVTTDVNAPMQTAYGDLPDFTPLMHMGFCDDTFTSTDPLYPLNCYLFGGMNNLSVYQTKIWAWPIGYGNAIVEKTAVLPKALIGLAAVYDINSDCCFLFGGYDGAAPVVDIYKYDPALDSLTDLTGTVSLPKALAYLAAAQCPATGKIYLFGGEEAGGDMSSNVYEFDPVASTIDEIEVVQSSGSDEVNEGGVGGPWAIKIGRWHAVSQIADIGDYGQIVLIGGRQDTNVGSLVSDFYVFDPKDFTMAPYRASEYGYVRYSTKYNLKFTTQVSRNFTGESSVGAGWSDPAGNWTITSNQAQAGVGGGPLICLTVPTYVNEFVSCTAIKSDAGTMVNFHIDLRATYDGAGVIQSGYRLIYTEADTTWRIYRYSGGVGTIEFTYSAAASPARRIDNVTVKTITFRAMLRDPVEFYAFVSYGGTNYTLFSSTATYDYDAERNTDLGLVAVGAQSGVATVIVDDFLFQTSAANEEKFTCSAAVKAEANNVSGYYRFSLVPSSAIDSIWCTRYCSQYYLVPPKTRYYWAKGRCDLRNGVGLKREDGVRLFHRVYWEGQMLYMDGLHLAKGTLIPTSYHAEGLARESEEFTFADVLNPNCFQLQFYFMPTFCFSDVEDNYLEIARVSVDASNYILLEVVPYAGHSRWCREYDHNSIDGPQDPIIRLSKVVSNSTIASMDLISYFGAAQMIDGDPVNENCEDVMRITIVNTPSQFGLKVHRWGSEGRKQDNTDLGNQLPASSASIVYSGVGYFSEPQILDASRSPAGRVFPARRAGILNRLRSKQRHGFLVGDRDPTNGVVAGQPFYSMGGLTFGKYDEFTRGDNSSLGDNWLEDIVRYNWRIASNQARCTGLTGFALMAFPPRHADIRIVANTRLSGDTAKVGILGRCGCEQNDTTLRPNISNGLFGYEARIERVSTTEANLVLYRHHKLNSVALQTVALSSYTAFEVLELVLDMLGTTIAASVTGRASISIFDDIHRRARGVGIYATSTGVNYSIIDDLAVYPNFDEVTGE